MRELIFTTHNEHKAIEIQSILHQFYRVLTLDQAGFAEEIPEEQDTLEGNALQKARFVYDRLGMDCFADDTGLEVDALNGEPGVYSARYAELSGDRMPEEQITDANIRRLLRQLEGVVDRRARFRTVIALIIGGEQYFFEGIVEGSIISAGRGDSGFGYDPVFLPRGYQETFAEMQLREKNAISHRARAVFLLADFLKNYTRE
jgi:XTP/dITP diphosphohydrolase